MEKSRDGLEKGQTLEKESAQDGEILSPPGERRDPSIIGLMGPWPWSKGRSLEKG